MCLEGFCHLRGKGVKVFFKIVLRYVWLHWIFAAFWGLQLR